MAPKGTRGGKKKQQEVTGDEELSHSPSPDPEFQVEVNGHDFQLRTETEVTRYERLTYGKRDVVGTRFLCIDTLSSLGLLDSITELLQRVGLEASMKKSAPTYTRVVLEFLTTVFNRQRIGGCPGGTRCQENKT